MTCIKPVQDLVSHIPSIDEQVGKYGTTPAEELLAFERILFFFFFFDGYIDTAGCPLSLLRFLVLCLNTLP